MPLVLTTASYWLESPFQMKFYYIQHAMLKMEIFLNVIILLNGWTQQETQGVVLSCLIWMRILSVLICVISINGERKAFFFLLFFLNIDNIYFFPLNSCCPIICHQFYCNVFVHIKLLFAFPKVLPALINKHCWSDLLLYHFYTSQRWSEQCS